MRKTKWALAAMAMSLHLSGALASDGPQAGQGGAGDQGRLEGFAVRFVEAKKDVTEASKRDLLVRGVPYHVVIEALGAEGKPLPAFADRAEVEGLFALDEEGNQKAIGRTGRFKDGRAIVENVFLSGDTVTVSHGSVAETVTPRTIPGWVTVVPPLLAIALAIVFRQVLITLLSGIWAGAIIIYRFNPVTALLRTFDTHVLGSLDPANASIILFTVALGGMIGVVGRSGGTRALVDAISRRAKSRRSGMIVT